MGNINISLLIAIWFFECGYPWNAFHCMASQETIPVISRWIIRRSQCHCSGDNYLMWNYAGWCNTCWLWHNGKI